MTSASSTGNVADVFLEQHHHAKPACRRRARASARQQARIRGGERVHILARIEQVEHRGLAHLLGQRQLHENAVHGGSALSAATRVSTSASLASLGSE
jgi:hypothetical protein